MMRKTSVYLTDDCGGGPSSHRGHVWPPQAELIREGVRRLISEVEREPRRFRSLGLGQGGGRSSHWTSDELYRKAMGDR